MNKEQMYQVIVAPLITEKSTMLAESKRQFAFKVARTANKGQIKRAVEVLFGKRVQAVNVLNVKPKKKRRRNIEGTRKGWKKAYVTLMPGEDLEFSEVSE